MGGINERWGGGDGGDGWSQLIIKETGSEVDLLTRVPRTGVYTIAPDGTDDFRRHATDWHGIVDESEAFFLRILAAGDFRYKGADLGALVTRGRLQGDDNSLERRCRQWISSVRGQYAGSPVVPLQPQPPVKESFKLA